MLKLIIRWGSFGALEDTKTGFLLIVKFDEIERNTSSRYSILVFKDRAFMPGLEAYLNKIILPVLPDRNSVKQIRV